MNSDLSCAALGKALVHLKSSALRWCSFGDPYLVAEAWTYRKLAHAIAGIPKQRHNNKGQPGKREFLIG